MYLRNGGDAFTLQKKLAEYLVAYPRLRRHSHRWAGASVQNDWEGARAGLKAAAKVAEVAWLEPGESVAVLDAQTFDGVSIRGVDTVRIVP